MGSARKHVKYYRLQYVQEEAGSRVDFGTHGMIFNSTAHEGTTVGKTQRYGGTGKYTNPSDSQCRAVDFLDTTSECYLMYKDFKPAGMRQGVEQDDGSTLTFINDVEIGKQGTGVDSKVGATGNPFGNGENGNTVADQLVFAIAMQESQVQLVSSIDAIQTWQDVMGSVGGVVAVAMSLVLNLMGSIETTIDPDGPIAEKLGKLAGVAKDSAARTAQATGLNINEETPDVIFSEEAHVVTDDIEMPEDSELQFDLVSNQPQFDELVLYSATGSSRGSSSVGGSVRGPSMAVSGRSVTQI